MTPISDFQKSDLVRFAVSIAGFPIVEFSVISLESINRLTFGLNSGDICAEDRGWFAVKAVLLHARTSALLRFSPSMDELRSIL